MRLRPQATPSAPAARRIRAFTILEALLMLSLLTALTMIAVAIWIKPPASQSVEEIEWQSRGGDATQLSPAAPVARDPRLMPEMTTDTEIRLDKTAPAKQSP